MPGGEGDRRKMRSCICPGAVMYATTRSVLLAGASGLKAIPGPWGCVVLCVCVNVPARKPSARQAAAIDPGLVLSGRLGEGSTGQCCL